VSEEIPGNGFDVTLREFASGQKLFNRYRLIKTLGRGGMGIVWLARDEELERDVALKFLPDLIIRDRAVLSDLKRETRRSLELTHKNIVRIYDFVNDQTSGCISMEYVDGDTLSNLRADKAHKIFEPDELQDWVSQLCDALDYAHNHARIVHRDLKPANLMVNQRGDLKVADFGIARSLSDSVSKLTMQQGKSGTLVYMSPQQLEGERGTHLDDVYSLGASLYELLTSKPPFYSGNIDRQIREKIPPSMTQRREELDIEGEPIDAAWEEVVRACLAKNPERRPQTVSDIAKRLEVPSPKTRRVAGTGAEKSRRLVPVLGAAGLLLLAAAGILYFGFYRPMQNRQLRGQAEMKVEIDKLRQGIMEYPHREAEVRSSQIEQNAAAIQEQTYAELGRQLGVDPKLLREKLPRFAEELKRASNASLYERANASYVAKDYAQAERLASEAAAQFQTTTPGNPKNILAALELAGLSAQKRIDYARAMEHFRAAENLTDRNRDLHEWAILQHEVGELLTLQGKYNDAEKVLRDVIQARARVLGPEHPDTLDTRHRLIYALTRQTKYPEAESEARAVLTLREKFLGPEHTDTVISRYNLADTLADQGKYPEAEELFRNVIRLDEKALGSDDARTIAARVGLATVLGSEGKNAEAESLYREVIKFDEKLYGPDHPNTLNARMNLATALHADGKYSDAEHEYREVIALEQKVIGAEHPDALIGRNNLAEMLDDEGKFADAERECRQIINIETRVLGPENLVTLNSRANLAIALIGQGKFAEALPEYSDVLNLMERALGLEHPDTLNYATKIGVALSQQNRIAEAKEIGRQLEERAKKTLGPDNEYTRKYSKLAHDLEARR
jgi:tetratricopeptide (TPR) repeat protein